MLLRGQKSPNESWVQMKRYGGDGLENSVLLRYQFSPIWFIDLMIP